MLILLKSNKHYSNPVFPKDCLKVILSNNNLGYRIINEAYHNYPYKNDFSFMIKLSLKKKYNVKFDKVDDAFNKIESKLIKKYNCHLIVRLNNKNLREVIFYSKKNINTNLFKTILQKLKHQNQIQLNVEKDENWQYVSKFID